MPPPDRFWTRVFGLAVAALLAYLLFAIFRPFFGPIIWALLIAFLLSPLNLALRRRLGGRKGLAALVMLVAVALGIVLPIGAVALAFGGQAVELGQSLAKTAQDYKIDRPEDLTRLPVVGRAVAWIDRVLPVRAEQIQGWLVQGAQRVLQFLLTHGRAFLFGAFGALGNLALLLFVLFFFFRDGDVLASKSLLLIPLEPKRKEKLLRHIRDVTRAVVFGTIVTAIVQGALIGIAFWIVGLPSPVVFGVLAMIASFVPFVGTALVVAPAVAYLFVQGVIWKTIFMLAWGTLVAGSADNFLRPALVSGRAEIGTLTALFGVIGGLSAFGIIGLFLGPVILALVLALIRFAEDDIQTPAVPGDPAAASPQT